MNTCNLTKTGVTIMSNQKILNHANQSEVDPDLLNNLELLINMEALENEESWDYLMSTDIESSSSIEVEETFSQSKTTEKAPAPVKSNVLNPANSSSSEDKGDL